MEGQNLKQFLLVFENCLAQIQPKEFVGPEINGNGIVRRYRITSTCQLIFQFR